MPLTTMMPQPAMILLYVEDIDRSADFYGRLFGLQPIEAAPNFRSYGFASGLRLALLSRRLAEPHAVMTGGGGEVVLPVESYDAVDAVCQDWRARRLNIVIPPTTRHFGRSFVAIDPDGHRLRVIAEAAPAQP